MIAEWENWMKLLVKALELYCEENKWDFAKLESSDVYAILDRIGREATELYCNERKDRVVQKSFLFAMDDMSHYRTQPMEPWRRKSLLKDLMRARDLRSRQEGRKDERMTRHLDACIQMLENDVMRDRRSR